MNTSALDVHSPHYDIRSDEHLIFRDYLLKDERLLWVGRPGGGLRPARFSLFHAIWVVWLVVFGTLETIDNLAKGRDLLSLELAFVGLVLLWWLACVVVAPLRDAAMRARQVYAVSSRRVFIARPGCMATVWLEDLHGLALERDGTVVIAAREIEPRNWWEARFDPFDQMPATLNDRLLYLRDAKRVFHLISAARSREAHVALAA